MKNKTLIQERLEKTGSTIGCYDNELERLSKKELDKVLDNLEYGDTDIEVSIRRKKHIVEIFHVDNEVDLKLTTPTEYEGTYGNNK